MTFTPPKCIKVSQNLLLEGDGKFFEVCPGNKIPDMLAGTVLCFDSTVGDLYKYNAENGAADAFALFSEDQLKWDEVVQEHTPIPSPADGLDANVQKIGEGSGKVGDMSTWESLQRNSSPVSIDSQKFYLVGQSDSDVRKGPFDTAEEADQHKDSDESLRVLTGTAIQSAGVFEFVAKSLSSMKNLSQNVELNGGSSPGYDWKASCIVNGVDTVTEPGGPLVRLDGVKATIHGSEFETKISGNGINLKTSQNVFSQLKPKMTYDELKSIFGSQENLSTKKNLSNEEAAYIIDGMGYDVVELNFHEQLNNRSFINIGSWDMVNGGDALIFLIPHEEIENNREGLKQLESDYLELTNPDGDEEKGALRQLTFEERQKLIERIDEKIQLILGSLSTQGKFGDIDQYEQIYDILVKAFPDGNFQSNLSAPVAAPVKKDLSGEYERKASHDRLFFIVSEVDGRIDLDGAFVSKTDADENAKSLVEEGGTPGRVLTGAQIREEFADRLEVIEQMESILLESSTLASKKNLSKSRSEDTSMNLSYPDGASYWNGTGKFQKESEELEKLIPADGPTKFLEAELVRAGSKIYHDLFNNGFGNNWSSVLAFLKAQNDVLEFTRPELLDWFDDYCAGRVIAHGEGYAEVEELNDDIIEYAFGKKDSMTTFNGDMWDWPGLPDVHEEDGDEFGSSDGDDFSSMKNLSGPEILADKWYVCIYRDKSQVVKEGPFDTKEDAYSKSTSGGNAFLGSELISTGVAKWDTEELQDLSSKKNLSDPSDGVTLDPSKWYIANTSANWMIYPCLPKAFDTEELAKAKLAEITEFFKEKNLGDAQAEVMTGASLISREGKMVNASKKNLSKNYDVKTMKDGFYVIDPKGLVSGPHKTFRDAAWSVDLEAEKDVGTPNVDIILVKNHDEYSCGDFWRVVASTQLSKKNLTAETTIEPDKYYIVNQLDEIWPCDGYPASEVASAMESAAGYTAGAEWSKWRVEKGSTLIAKGITSRDPNTVSRPQKGPNEGEHAITEEATVKLGGDLKGVMSWDRFEVSGKLQDILDTIVEPDARVVLIKDRDGWYVSNYSESGSVVGRFIVNPSNPSKKFFLRKGSEMFDLNDDGVLLEIEGMRTADYVMYGVYPVELESLLDSGTTSL